MYSRNALISDSTVIHVFDTALEFLQDEIHATAPGQQKMLAVFDTTLFCPFGGSDATVVGQVGTLREEQEPHRIEILFAIRGSMAHFKFSKTVG